MIGGFGLVDCLSVEVMFGLLSAELLLSSDVVYVIEGKEIVEVTIFHFHQKQQHYFFFAAVV